MSFRIKRMLKLAAIPWLELLSLETLTGIRNLIEFLSNPNSKWHRETTLTSRSRWLWLLVSSMTKISSWAWTKRSSWRLDLPKKKLSVSIASFSRSNLLSHFMYLKETLKWPKSPMTISHRCTKECVLSWAMESDTTSWKVGHKVS